MKKRMRLGGSALLVLLAGALSAPPIRAAGPGFRGGFYIGALFSSVSGPTFRYPSGSDQLSIDQSKSAPNFVAGYDFGFGQFGLGVRASYLSAGFDAFATPSMPGGMDFVGYSDPKYTMMMGDFLLHWAPGGNGFFSVYGFLGLGVSTKSYTISGSFFPEWNGAKSLTEFEYSYGLGVRVRPVTLVSFFGEIRLIPGDQIYEGRNFLYSDGIFDYYEYGVSYTAHTTSVFAGGLSIHF